MAEQRRVDLSEDRAWLDAYRRGEEQALERVFRTYAPYVIVILRRGVHGQAEVQGLLSSADLEDVLHNVFLSALSEPTRNRYDGLRPYAPFIGQIARHRLVDHLRKASRQPASWAEVEDNALPAWTPAAPLPDVNAQANVLRAQVQAFKAALDEGEQAFIQVRFEQGASQASTAETLGTTRQRVRTMEAQIRQKFRAFVASTDLEIDDQGAA